jgi:MSHA biogenesis protein MshP
MVSALFLIVVLAALGAAISKISVRQHTGSATDLGIAQAVLAARSGLEWGAFQVLRNPAPPAAAPACFSNTNMTLAGTLSGMTVTVTCTRTPGAGTVSDGGTAMVFYQLVANACNAPTSGACPATGTLQPTYVERQLTWVISR